MMKKLFAFATLVFMLGSIAYAGEALQNGVHAAGSSAQGIQVQGNDMVLAQRCLDDTLSPELGLSIIKSNQ